MSRQFNVSAIFQAIDRFSEPVKRMGATMKNFNDTVKAAGGVNSSLSGISSAALNTRSSLQSLNNVSLDRLRLRVKDIATTLTTVGNRLDTISDRAIGAGFAGIAAGYGLNKTLDPIREAEQSRARLGGLFSDPSSSVADKLKVGKQHEQAISQMALSLPGSASDFVKLVALLKNYNMNYNKETLRRFTDLAAGGGIQVNELFMDQLESMAAGNRNALDNRFGLKTFTDKKSGQVGFKISGTDQEVTFKNTKEQFDWLLEYGQKRYKGMTDALMAGTAGKESNLSDVLQKLSKDVWENSGALDVYKSKVDEFVKTLQDINPDVTNFVKPIAEFSKNNSKLVNGIIVGVPSLILFGGALKLISFALSPLSGLFSLGAFALGKFSNGLRALGVAMPFLRGLGAVVGGGLFRMFLPELLALSVALPRLSGVVMTFATVSKMAFLRFAAWPVALLTGLYAIGKNKESIRAFGRSIKEGLQSGLKELKSIRISDYLPSFKDAVTGIGEGVIFIGEIIKDAFVGIVDALIGDDIREFMQIGSQIVEQIKSGLSALPQIKDYIVSKFQELYNAAVAKASEFLNVGSKLVESIKTGIGNAWNTLSGYVSNLISSLSSSMTFNPKINVNPPTSPTAPATAQKEGFKPTALKPGNTTNVIHINQTHNISGNGQPRTITKVNAGKSNTVVNLGQNRRTA